jgi:hypothetical protein
MEWSDGVKKKWSVGLLQHSITPTILQASLN